MFAIVGIVLLLVQGLLRPQELVVELQSLPLLGLGCAATLFGFTLDYKLRRTQLRAAPQLGWTLALLAWCAATQPHASELVLPLAIYLSLSQGVQSFRGVAAVAAVLLALAWVSSAGGLLRLGSFAPGSPLHGDGEPALTLAVTAPLAFAFFARKRNASRFFFALSTVVAFGLCVILTQSRPLPLASRASIDAPTLLLAFAPLYVSFKILVVLGRHYSDAADAAVVRSWTRPLLVSLAALAAGLLVFPLREHVVYFVFYGLVGALFGATRAHDAKLELRFDRRDLARLVIIAAALWALRAWCL